MASISIRAADLSTRADQEAVLAMVDAYASDPMGNGEPLCEEIKRRLIPGLQNHPTTRVFLAFEESKPIGIALCFAGFSSFKAKPLLNIHDLAVLPEYRGKGVGRSLLQAVEQFARERDFCAVTLEVDERNHRALETYLAAGFQGEREAVDQGRTFFMKKLLA